MKVAVDVTPLVGHRTGIGRSVAELVAALERIDDGAGDMSLLPYALGLRTRRHRAELPPGTHVVPVPTRLLLASWSRIDAPSIDPWVDGASVVHATNFIAPPTRRPSIVTVHDCSFEHYPQTVDTVVRRFGPVLRRAVARGITVHVTTEYVAGEVDAIYGPGLRDAGRLTVVPFGVPTLGGRPEPEAASPSVPAVPASGRPYVLALGTLEPRKNLAALVRAFGAVATGHPDVQLVLAGRDGPARPAVDAAVAALPAGVGERVVIAGSVADGARRDLLAGARVLAYPSLYEGFGFPMLEAMTLGVPVLAARAGALPEVAGDAAELADPTDVDALAAALGRLLTDETRRRELVERGHARVRTFRWDDTARGISALYRRLAR
jgi:glycosyltransferase involved in cell wall biosynthesis